MNRDLKEKKELARRELEKAYQTEGTARAKALTWD